MIRESVPLVLVALAVGLASPALAQDDPFAEDDDPFADKEDPFAEYERQVNETTNATAGLTEANDSEQQDDQPAEDNTTDDEDQSRNIPGPGVATAVLISSAAAWAVRQRL